MLDYEVLNPDHPDRIRGHHEHTMIGRTHDGGAVMVIGHIHGDVGRGAARDRTGDVRTRRRGLAVPDEGRGVDAGAGPARAFVVVRPCPARNRSSVT